MKRSIAAPFCSGLVIPGLGQILNRQIRKGLILMGLVFLLFVAGAVKLAFIVGSLTRSPDPPQAFQGPTVATGDLLFLTALVLAFAILWIYSVVDALLVALRSKRLGGDEAL